MPEYYTEYSKYYGHSAEDRTGSVGRKRLDTTLYDLTALVFVLKLLKQFIIYPFILLVIFHDIFKF